MKRGELVYTLEEIDDVGLFLYNQLLDYPIMAFTGTLGAGKTTLVQAILRTAGIDEAIPSPTFAYVHSYANHVGYTFHHFDLYRLTNARQFIEHGFLDYLTEPQAYTLIEWPELITSLLPKRTAWVALDSMHEGQRRVRYELV